MEESQRKASDILLSIENQLAQLLSETRSQGLVNKIIANKLNALLSGVPLPSSNDQEFTDLEDNMSPTVIITPEQALPIENSPNGFRRTSRPETFSKEHQNSFLPNSKPLSITENKLAIKTPEVKQESADFTSTSGKVSVIQRIVDKNSKAIFLADVEVTNSANNTLEQKTRTNAMGKWSCQLSPGSYRVKIKKMESLTKEKFEVLQDITIDGKHSQQELQMMIIK